MRLQEMKETYVYAEKIDRSGWAAAGLLQLRFVEHGPKFGNAEALFCFVEVHFVTSLSVPATLALLFSVPMFDPLQVHARKPRPEIEAGSSMFRRCLTVLTVP